MSAFISAPGEWKAVVPSDATTYTNIRGLYVGGAGNLAVDFGNGVVTVPVLAGAVLPMLGVQKVMATGTTATSIFRIG